MEGRREGQRLQPAAMDVGAIHHNFRQLLRHLPSDDRSHGEVINKIIAFLQEMKSERSFLLHLFQQRLKDVREEGDFHFAKHHKFCSANAQPLIKRRMSLAIRTIYLVLSVGIAG